MMQDVHRAGSTTYAYDNLYRLIEVRDGAGQTVRMGYDPFGNRTQFCGEWAHIMIIFIMII
jgi:YD repeat-containing protein